MKLAIQYPAFDHPGTIPATLAATARAAEDGGAVAFTMMDHWFQIPGLGTPSSPMLEGYTALGFLAALTSRITLGLLVTGVTYRHPGLLAKTVATLGVLSGGRAMLGLGAAWNKREHDGLGVPFPPPRERLERVEETLLICAQMWSDDDGPYAGRHYRLAETVCEPRPPSRPRIVVGGGGERRTLRLVARHADACNLFASDPETVRRKLHALDRHCAEAGRDPATVRRTISWFGADPFAADFLPTMEKYAALGVDQIWVNPHGPDPAGWVARVCERVLPDLREI